MPVGDVVDAAVSTALDTTGVIAQGRWCQDQGPKPWSLNPTPYILNHAVFVQGLLGTAVTVQSMVFGNLGPTSGCSPPPHTTINIRSRGWRVRFRLRGQVDGRGEPRSDVRVLTSNA